MTESALAFKVSQGANDELETANLGDKLDSLQTLDVLVRKAVDRKVGLDDEVSEQGAGLGRKGSDRSTTHLAKQSKQKRASHSGTSPNSASVSMIPQPMQCLIAAPYHIDEQHDLRATCQSTSLWY